MYSILVTGINGNNAYFNNWFSRNQTAVNDVLNHLVINDRENKFEVVEVTEEIIQENKLNCLEELLETYLLIDGNLYFLCNKKIMQITYKGLKYVKVDVEFAEVKEQIEKRITWNGWCINEYIVA